MNNEKIAEFESLYSEIKRDGAERLLEFIRKSDFFTAPASTKYHGAAEGGLLEHSLNVVNVLLKKVETDSLWKEKLSAVSRESLIICGLLHDLCKTYFYNVEMRNKKDESGNWIKVPFYVVDDQVPYGHGEKSVMMIEEYIKLQPVERYAIRWHMGPYSGQQDWGTLGLAMERYPLVLALFEADMEATHICESD